MTMDDKDIEEIKRLVEQKPPVRNRPPIGALPKYADKEYWEQHRTICFDTLYEHGEYEVTVNGFQCPETA